MLCKGSSKMEQARLKTQPVYSVSKTFSVKWCTRTTTPRMYTLHVHRRFIVIKVITIANNNYRNPFTDRVCNHNRTKG